jgi:hypothetical protein
VAEVELTQAVAKAPAAVTAAVVRHDALNGDAQGGVIGEGGAQEGEGGAMRLVGKKKGEGDTGVIVDGHVQVLPTRTGAAPIAPGMVAELGAVKAAESFDVEMEQAAGLSVFVAPRRGSGIEGLETMESAVAQDATDGRAAETGVLGDPEAGPALAAQGLDLCPERRMGAPGRSAWAGGAVGQSAPALLTVTAHPFGGGFRAHVEGGGRRLQRCLPEENSLCQGFST